MHVGIEAYTSVYTYVLGCETCNIELQLDAIKYRNIHVQYLPIFDTLLCILSLLKYRISFYARL